MCKYWVSDEYNGDGDCELEPVFECDHCKFGKGTLNPLAKKFQRTNANIQQQVQADSASTPNSLT